MGLTQSYPELGPVTQPPPPPPPSISYSRDSREGIATAGGVIDIDFGSPPEGYLWLVDRMLVSTTSALTTAVAVYVGNDVIVQNEVDASGSGNSDVADNNQPIPVNPGESLKVRFTGATAASKGTVNITRRVQKQAS